MCYTKSTYQIDKNCQLDWEIFHILLPKNKSSSVSSKWRYFSQVSWWRWWNWSSYTWTNHPYYSIEKNMSNLRDTRPIWIIIFPKISKPTHHILHSERLTFHMIYRLSYLCFLLSNSTMTSAALQVTGQPSKTFEPMTVSHNTFFTRYHASFS